MELRRFSLLFVVFAALSCLESAGAALWSLRPVTDPVPPASDGVESPIDAFIRARLQKAGLILSREADRRTLIRRVTVDLHGLLPTPEEVEDFLNDARPNAYELVIERLLASPRYGERRARHWLDVARYTESQGFEYDHLRPNGWHYRDYVIQALNNDKPYDLFVREQIAGDVLSPHSPEALVATSLLVCGAYDQAGNAQANVTQKAISREDELEDLVSTVGQGVLGITVNCARCHAHKFDPVPQADYYRLKAVFEGVKHGERDVRWGGKASTSYVGLRKQPAPTKVLKRGDVLAPGEEVRPGGLSAIDELPSDLGLPADAPEAERRLRFAEWLTDQRNPLTPRVMANRVWLYHFGQGLVSTPSDFGNSGGTPSHPELLDWLATYLMKNDWSLKAMHRVILRSRTYRQSSEWNVAGGERDADNELLWRFKPLRLDAEVLRDSILAASGSMNWQMGGPSFRPFEIVTFNSSSYFPKDVSGAEYDRRTIYRANVNSGKDPLLQTLDCPDPSVRTPKRMATITPLQALSLMNNPFVQRESERLAARVTAETSSPEKAIARAYEIVLSRPPSADEARLMRHHAEKQGLASVCWTLFNSTELLYVQ